MSILCILLGVFFAGCAGWAALRAVITVHLMIRAPIVSPWGLGYAVLMFGCCAVACWSAAYCFGQ